MENVSGTIAYTKDYTSIAKLTIKTSISLDSTNRVKANAVFAIINPGIEYFCITENIRKSDYRKC